MVKVSDEELLKLWKDPSFEGSFRGIKTFQILLKTNLNIDVSEDRLFKVLKSESLYLIHKKYHSFKRLKYNLHNYGEVVQVDLGHMFEFDGFKYFLLAIDCYSSKLFIEVLKNKDSDTVVKALKNVIVKFKSQIYKLESDQGSEFKNKSAKALFKEHNIFFKYKFGKNKAAYVERYIFLVKKKLFMLLRSELSENWVKYIKLVVNSMNKTPIKKLGYLAPNDISSERDSVSVDIRKRELNISSESYPTFEEQNQLSASYQDTTKNLKKGDYVYKQYNEKLFDKKYNVSVRFTYIFSSQIRKFMQC